jgi:hypothetical protein
MNLITNVRELVASGLPQIVAAVLEEKVVSPGALLVARRAGSAADGS